MDRALIKQSLKCGCPECGEGPIFQHRYTLDVKDVCPFCGYDLKNADSGDGPAVFMIFILGFLMTPLALLVDAYMPMPLWAHSIVWTVVGLMICLLTMQPIKAYVIALNYKHRDGANGA